MRNLVPSPIKGEGLRASWGAAVANRVNELCAMAPAGMLPRDGVGGMGAEPLPQNLRNRVAISRKPACFDFAMEPNENTGETTYKLVRCYYNTGGKTVHVNDIDITDTIASSGEGNILAFARQGYTGSWAAMLFSDESDLAEFQEQAANYAVPLYVMAARETDSNGESSGGIRVAIDLRNAPQIQFVEELS